jgi:hypothetical protein
MMLEPKPNKEPLLMGIASAPILQNPMLPAGVSFVGENESIEIGKMYNVKCAIMSNGESSHIIPIIGEPHNDKQFGFSDKHYHIDGRFITKKDRNNYTVTEDGKTNAVCPLPPTSSYYKVVDIIIKKRKCFRLTTGINPPLRNETDFRGKPKAEKFWAWADTMIGKSCKGKKCPHLGTMMEEQNGMLLCPLHNLQGCITSEVIVSVACR